jgi:hypothetical protein
MAADGSNMKNVGTATLGCPAGQSPATLSIRKTRLDTRKPRRVSRAWTAEGGCPYIRSSGRVRHVGPPEPLIQISDPGNVRTSKPASRMI